MNDYEKLGVFYLGRHHDPASRQTRTEPLLYDSRHLVTHGLVVGMTGSGKTGLCVGLLEEAAIDGVPAIVIDPKGDLGNLLLTFPELRPEDFAPWVNEDDARKQNRSVAEVAASQAELWRQGLAAWDQPLDRIRRLRDAAEFLIYTPGSNAGLPVSILSSFATPPVEVLEDAELLRDRVGSTVAGLLGLIGIDADPIRSRERILLSQLIQQAWAQGRDLDLATLIHEVQNPPLQRIGVLDLDAFFPAKDRFTLAMQLNNLLASPGFTAWLQGEPLDVGRLLHSAAGRPRVAIFSIAHLSDAERMFFVTLLLNQVLGWMRAQSGTASLRAVVYMDEIAGYFSPVANPPSKQPLLTLLKQGRAFGVGVLLATQNPVDLDYKGLANIGSWFVGRLQTDRDKMRVLEGLEGASAGRGAGFDRAGVEQILAGLGRRVFLLHNVHEEGFDLFESRWAMSYLRGPLSRTHIRALMDRSRHDGTSAPAAVAGARATSSAGAIAVGDVPAANSSAGASAGRPVFPPEIPQVFVPVRGTVPAGSRLIYLPRLLGAAQVRFADAKSKTDVRQDVLVTTEIADTAVPVDWAAGAELAIPLNDLEKTPADADYAPCPSVASQARNYAVWAKDFANWIYGNRKLVLFKSSILQAISQLGEQERDFRIRLQQVAREQRDAATESLRRKYAPKLATLQERLRRAEAAKQRETAQATRAKFDTVISFGSTLLGAFLGRRAVSATGLGRAAGTMRSAGRAMEQAGDVARAQESVEAIQTQAQELQAQFDAEVNALAAKFDPAAERLERVELYPAKSHIQVRLVALVWLPFWQEATGIARPAYGDGMGSVA